MTRAPRIVEIITKAHAAGRRYPKIHLRTNCGLTIKLYRAGPKSKFEGDIQVTDGEAYDSNVWYGRISKSDGAFVRSRQTDRRLPQQAADVAELIAAFDHDPAGVAAAYGLHTGECAFCARELTDNRSCTVGYGPTCAKNYGLPWGANAMPVPAVEGDPRQIDPSEATPIEVESGVDPAEDALAAFETASVTVHPPVPAFPKSEDSDDPDGIWLAIVDAVATELGLDASRLTDANRFPAAYRAKRIFERNAKAIDRMCR